MRLRLIRTASACLAALAMGSPVLAAGPTAAGLWEKLDQSGKPAAWFRIIECNGVYVGRIVKIFPQPGQTPSNLRCTQCGGDQKNAPVLGIVLIKGMRRDGQSYAGGSILDPRDGSVYNAVMELSPDGQQLTVRGYIGIPLLGQSEVWRRLPGSAQPPGFAACPQS
jgi:uncharacterized protein (DUF2147 family)